MARDKIQSRKINNAIVRQVTFSRRRRELFKKAEELSVLCDADVGIVIFSSTGKLFEYSNSSMRDILERCSLHSKNIHKLDQPSLELQLVEDSNCSKLSKEVTEKILQLRQMRGEELQGLSIEELQELEISLEAGPGRVIDKRVRGEYMNQISSLREKGKQLMEENNRLRQQVMEICNGEKHAHDDSENVFGEERQASDSIFSKGNSNGPPLDYESSDTISLRLGLPYSG